MNANAETLIQVKNLCKSYGDKQILKGISLDMLAQELKELRSDENDPLFDKTNMLKKEFPSDFRQIRYFTLLIVARCLAAYTACRQAS